MTDCEDHGGIVELQFLDLGLDGFLLNGQPVNMASLVEHEVRLMLENVSIIMAKAANLKIINTLRESADSHAMRCIMDYVEKHGISATLKILESYQTTLKNRIT
jgi:hypothetical protein